MLRMMAICCLFIYIAGAVGLRISINYCNGQLTGIGVHCMDYLRCCDGPENECCDSEVIQVQSTDDHTIGANDKFLLQPIAAVTRTTPFFFRDNTFGFYSRHQLCTARLRPPPLLASAGSLYLKNSVFRI